MKNVINISENLKHLPLNVHSSAKSTLADNVSQYRYALTLLSDSARVYMTLYARRTCRLVKALLLKGIWIADVMMSVSYLTKPSDAADASKCPQ